MDTRILIKILGAGEGARAEFRADKHAELTIGRDPSCDLKFDPNNDLVSRRHAKITRANDTGEYTVADLGSRNGTFVNKQRIFEPVSLNCGDIVQLGPGGPEFQFDLDPRPAAAVRPTRLADDISVVPVSSGALPATREAGPPAAMPAPVLVGAPTKVGRATVERMITQIKAQNQKQVYALAAAALVLVAGVTWALFHFKKPPVIVNNVINQRLLPDGLTPTQISLAHTDATVMIETSWKLVEMSTGKQLFHVVIPNQQEVKDKNGKPVKDKDGKPKMERIAQSNDEFLPVFVKTPSAGYQPVLSTNDNQGRNFPIGSPGGGSGFVVSSDGFILTNRHVAAEWYTQYGFLDEAQKVQYGVLINLQNGEKQPVPSQQFGAAHWVPAQATVMVNEKGDLTQINPNPLFGKTLEGRNDVLDVSFPHNRMRMPAHISRISDRMDVAMIKVDTPANLPKLELNDNWDSIKIGDPVLVMGYPDISEAMYPIVGIAASKDLGNQTPAQKVIADPTVSVGNVSRLVRGNVLIGEGEHFGGDLYQLTINSTGHGNSGGPLFDGHGKVIGIFTMGWSVPGEGPVNVTAAIPIRYGMELMGVKTTAD